MDNVFEISNYSENLNSLIQVIKLNDIRQADEQYDKTVRSLSRVLRCFTSEAEDVAKFVVCTDLSTYVEPVNKGPLGLSIALKKVWSRKDSSVEKDNIRSFGQDKLKNFTTKRAAECINILSSIGTVEKRLSTLLKTEYSAAPKEALDSKQGKKEKHRLHKVDLESASTSKQKEEEQPKKESASNQRKKTRKLVSPLLATTPNEFKPELQGGSAATEEKIYFKLKPGAMSFNSLGCRVLSDREYNKKISSHQEKRLIRVTAPDEGIEAKKARKHQQQSEPAVLPKLSVVPSTSEKAANPRQKTKKHEEPIMHLNLCLADQQVSMIPRIEITPCENRVTPVTQADISVEKNLLRAPLQSHLPPTKNERSKISTATAGSSPKTFLIHVSVKEMVAQFESRGKK